MSRQECIQGFSDNIFWDVDRNQIDLSQHAPYVVQRVLEYGQISDWKLLLAYYGLDEIVSISKNLRSLEPRALAFISTISRTPQEQFRCYNTRQSLDLFGTIEADSLEIRETLEESHTVSVVKESKNIHIYLVDGVKVDFVNYRYSWIDEAVIDSDITLASVKDIAAMKIAAVIGRGTKKDFIDIDILLRSFTLQELLELYLQKYPDGTLFIAMKSLTYFEDAESDPMPFMFEETDWEDVKTRIREAVIGL